MIEAQREALDAAEEFSNSVEESIKFGLDSVATSLEESLYNVKDTLQKEGFKKSCSEVTASNQKVSISNFCVIPPETLKAVAKQVIAEEEL